MNIVGTVVLIAGGLLVVQGFVSATKGGSGSVLIQALIQGSVALTVGGFTLTAAGAFRRIVDSRGDSIGPLMTALDALRFLFRTQVVILCLGLGLLALAFCMARLCS